MLLRFDVDVEAVQELKLKHLVWRTSHGVRDLIYDFQRNVSVSVVVTS